MPDRESLRMNETRRVERRVELERLVEALNDELDMFMQTGATDKSMCNGV